MPRPSSTTASRAAASSAHRTAQHHSQHAQQSANPLRSGGAGALDKAAAAQASSTASVLRGRHFPNPVAVFSESFVFTTLDEGHLEKHRRAPFVHPHTKQACRLFTCELVVLSSSDSEDHGGTRDPCVTGGDSPIADERQCGGRLERYISRRTGRLRSHGCKRSSVGSAKY